MKKLLKTHAGWKTKLTIVIGMLAYWTWSGFLNLSWCNVTIPFSKVTAC